MPRPTLVGVILDHVQLAAPPGCEPQARRFFTGVLELEEIEKPESLRDTGGVWFTVGGNELHIGVTEPFVPARKAHPAFRVARDELERLAERLTAAGSPVNWDERLPAVRRFYTEDPWGNRLEMLATAD